MGKVYTVLRATKDVMVHSSSTGTAWYLDSDTRGSSVLPLIFSGVTGTELLGLTMPPEMMTLKASSIDIDKLTKSASGTIAYHPVVGFGVVGMKMPIGVSPER